MVLWTVQAVEVYKEILQKGSYTCKKSNTNIDNDYINSYEYISEYMRSIIGGENTEELYPIWAWYKCDRKNKQPNLKHMGYSGNKKEYVLLQIEKDDRDVLLSDFDLWHFVLNNEYYIEETSEKLYDEKMAKYERLFKEEKQREKVNSWNSIFHIEKSEYIQATFWRLNIKDIKKVKFFKAN